MIYLLDTDICIYWLKGQQSVQAQVQQVGIQNLAISTITAAELYYGAYYSQSIARNLQRATTFIQNLAVLNLTLPAVQQFGELKASLRKTGTPIADMDFFIASIALTKNRVLVTNNLRHYQRIPGLKLENWATLSHEH
ncbi:MAG: PIN domain-containing protein [Prochlorothrix sp.]|nr:PIN domain-containing protein [Prochlorothrix sp.]